MAQRTSFQPEGTDSNQLKDELQRTNLVPLHRTDFSMDILNKWSDIRTLNKPKRRSHHTSFIYESFLYVIGGVDISDIKQEDMYKINLEDKEPRWESVVPKGTPLRKIAYHAGALLKDNYWFYGGQTATLQSSNVMWKFDVTACKLEIIHLDGNQCPHLESHTCDVYENKMIIFGGHKDKVFNNEVYCFNPETKEFTKLTNNIPAKSKPSARQEHASLIVNDDLYIFGGVGKNDQLFNDLWKFNLKSMAFTQINYDSMDKDFIPGPRFGHSMILDKNQIYIFGGFLGLVNESNELWEYDISQNKYILLHDSIAEKFSEEDLEKTKKSLEDHAKIKKKFRWLTKHEVELRTNPLPFSSKDNKTQKNKSHTVQKSNSLTDIKTAHSNEVLNRPNVIKMKKSLVYTSVEEDLNNALHKLSKNEKTMASNENSTGKLPEPRDGHSMLIYKDTFIVFAGDRNKFPFNDLYSFSLN